MTYTEKYDTLRMKDSKNKNSKITHPYHKNILFYFTFIFIVYTNTFTPDTEE